MGIVKRALLFLKRNVGKTVLLSFVTLIIGVLIFATTTAITGLNKTVSEQLEGVSPYVNIELDYDRLYEEYPNGSYPAEINNESLTEDQVKTIESSEYWIKTSRSSAVQLEWANESDYKTFVPDIIPFEGETDIENSMGFSMGGVYAQGVDTIDTNFYNGGATYNYQFTTEQIQNKQRVVILNDEFMKANGLKIGDTVQLTLSANMGGMMPGTEVEQGELIDFKIVGDYTYTVSEEEIDQVKKQMETYETAENPNFMLAWQFNNVLVPVDTAVELKKIAGDKFLEERGYASASDIPENSEDRWAYDMYSTRVDMSFSYDDAKNKDAFIAEINALIPEDSYLSAVDFSTNFEGQYGLLSSILEYSGIVLVGVVLFSSLFLGLVIISFIRDRKKEIGILISLGEKRKKIYLQSAIELGVVVFGGFTLSIPLGYIVANILANWDQIIYGGLSVTQIFSSDMVLPFTVNSVLLMYLVGVLIVLLATLLPMLYMMRLKPKKILL